MAIARDTSGSWTQAAGKTTWTQAYTCTGSNGYLAVTVNITTVGDTITATATYAGAAMTAQFNLVGGDNRRVYYFYKLGPATGSNNIVITFSGTTTFATSMCAASYTGVSQTGFPDSSASQAATTSPISASTTVVASNCWIVSCAGGETTSALTATGVTTSLVTITSAVGNSTIFDSNGTVSTGSNASGFTQSAGDKDQIGVVSIAPAATAVNSGFLNFM